MAGITQLADDWEQWIRTNISRGVPPDMLVEDMVKKDFDRAFAIDVVMQRLPLTIATSATSRSLSPISSENEINIDGHGISVACRSREPEVVLLQHVLSAAECDDLIALSKHKLKRSTTIDPSSGAEQIIDARSSEGTYFMRGENELVSRIERRLATLTGMPSENGEGLQILHYGPGGEYQPHFDFFEPEDPGSSPHLVHGGQRVSTTIIYLNDVAAGGETIFPDIRFSVTPRKGMAVYFSYCDSNGELDRLTLHGGAPVRHGEKWIATHWLRQGAHR
jgi:prolyl 4-hydroxylase